MGRAKPKITFFGHFGGDNFGNESTLFAMLSNFRRFAPDAEFACICTGPETVATDYDIVAVPSRVYVVKPRALRNPLARLARKLVIRVPSELYRLLNSVKMLSGADALIVPGTGLLSDAYGLFSWGPYDMFRWCVAAKLCRSKVLFVSVGAGPIYSRAGRFFVKASLRLAHSRSYRDESSRQWLKRIGFPADKDPVYPDLAFSLPATELSLGRDRKGCKTVVGIGLMEYAGKYSAERCTSTIHRAYLEILVEFVEWLLAHEYNVRLLIGDLADTAVTQEFRSVLKERDVTYEDERIIDEPVASFSDVLSQIAATDFVVATRFHNVLFSLLLNKPTIAISFHHKCSSLMSQMGLAEYCEDINALEVDRLIEQFGRLEKNATSLKAMMAQRVKGCQNELDEQYGLIFNSIFRGGRQVAPPVTEINSSPNRSLS